MATAVTAYQPAEHRINVQQNIFGNHSSVRGWESKSILFFHSNTQVEVLPEERDVGDGEAECVDLGEALLVRERRHVQPQLLERRVDARRTAAGKEGKVKLNLYAEGGALFVPCHYHSS